jgi:hypothetical protein
MNPVCRAAVAILVLVLIGARNCPVYSAEGRNATADPAPVPLAPGQVIRIQVAPATQSPGATGKQEIILRIQLESGTGTKPVEPTDTTGLGCKVPSSTGRYEWGIPQGTGG